jgi:hypothetical protein
MFPGIAIVVHAPSKREIPEVNFAEIANLAGGPDSQSPNLSD